MTDKEKLDIGDTIKMLLQLDKQSLLLIDSGIRLLAARQQMEKELSNKIKNI